MQCSVAPQHEDPFFFDREGLAAVASAEVVGEGLRFFKEHRVISVDQDQDWLRAQIEDDALEFPCMVDLSTTDEGLQLECDCGDGSAVCVI